MENECSHHIQCKLRYITFFVLGLRYLLWMQNSTISMKLTFNSPLRRDNQGSKLYIFTAEALEIPSNILLS